VTARSAINGSPIHWDKNKNTWEPDGCEPCPKCGRMPTPEGYDACIGFVPGAASVCCGHGIVPPYIVFEGDDAVAAIAWAQTRHEEAR